MKQRRRTEVFNTIDEIKRDYQASSAFQYLLDKIKDKDIEIGTLKSEIYELSDLLEVTISGCNSEKAKSKFRRIDSYLHEIRDLKREVSSLKKKKDDLIIKLSKYGKENNNTNFVSS